MACLNTTEAVKNIKRQRAASGYYENSDGADHILSAARAGGELETGAVVFSGEEGILGQTENAERLLD